MNVHKNARLTPYRRAELVARMQDGEPGRHLALAFGVSVRTVRKWWARFRTEGLSGLADRSSRPHRSARQTPNEIRWGIEVLRRQRWSCAEIGAAVGVSPATTARILRRAGLSRRGRFTPPPVAERYEHPRPGDLLHLDMKKLGRIAGLGHRITGRAGNVNRHQGIGWEALHIAIDDHSRVAYVELLRDESARWFPSARRARPAHPYGQRLRVHLSQLSGDVSRPSRRPSAHATVHATHEREGRTLYSDGTAGVGVSAAVLHVRRSRPFVTRLARALQLRAPAWQPSRAAPDGSFPGREQPHENPQLAMRPSRRRRKSWRWRRRSVDRRYVTLNGSAPPIRAIAASSRRSIYHAACAETRVPLLSPDDPDA